VLRDDVHALIRVSRPSSADKKVRAKLSQHKASCCVLAPFAIDDQLFPKLRWEQQELVLQPGWRARLVRWAARRLVGVPEKWEKNADDWLTAVDPTEQLFGTPGDVLTLLKHFHVSGVPPRSRPIAELARELATDAMGNHAQAFMRSRGARFAEEMIQGRFTTADADAGPLDAAGWARFMPENLAQVAPPRKAARAKAPRDLFDETAIRYGDTVVEALESHGDLLRVQRCGRLDFAPWLRLAVERACVLEAVEKGEPTWARWALDPGRYRQVEAAFDALPPTQRFKPAMAAVASDFSDIVQTTMVEVTFAAAMRWFAAKTPRLDAKLGAELRALATAQLRIVRDVGPHGCMGPATLPYTDAERRAWFDNAWTYSFMEPFDLVEGPAPGLILPGWKGDIDTARDSKVLDLLWNVERPMRYLQEVLGKVPHMEVPDLLPMELVVAFIRDERFRGRLTQSHWQMFFEGDRSVEALCEPLAENRNREQRAPIATVTFDAAREFAGSNLKNFFQRPQPLLELWCTDVDPDRWDALVRVHPWGALNALELSLMTGRAPAGLPRVVLQAYGRIPADKRGTSFSFHYAPDALQTLDVHDIELLVDLVKSREPPGEQAAARAWEVAPRTALAEAKRALLDRTPTDVVWFHTAPAAALEELVGELEQQSEPLPEWVEGWLRARLARAGGLAPSVYGLLRRAISHARETA
jgi:hypothetical protein